MKKFEHYYQPKCVRNELVDDSPSTGGTIEAPLLVRGSDEQSKTHKQGTSFYPGGWKLDWSNRCGKLSFEVVVDKPIPRLDKELGPRHEEFKLLNHVRRHH